MYVTEFGSKYFLGTPTHSNTSTGTDSSLAMQPVFKNFRSVIITSGTLSPISLYPHLLNFTPKISQAFEMTMPEDRGTILCPLIVTRGSDQTELTTKFEARDDPAISRNYGDLLVNLSQHVPDGIVCFFTSYVVFERSVRSARIPNISLFCVSIA